MISLKNKNLKKYIIVSILPIIILFSMTVLPLLTYFNGQEVFIETKPVDPRDVFRGDYVYLEYKINEIDMNKVPDELKDKTGYVKEKYRNKQVYVVLKKHNAYYDVDYITLKKPKDKLYLKAKYNYTITNWEGVQNNNQKEKIMGIRVDYNLDKYFVPENTGKQLEEKSRKGELQAKIKVYKGYALLVDIY